MTCHMRATFSRQTWPSRPRTFARGCETSLPLLAVPTRRRRSQPLCGEPSGGFGAFEPPTATETSCSSNDTTRPPFDSSPCRHGRGRSKPLCEIHRQSQNLSGRQSRPRNQPLGPGAKKRLGGNAGRNLRPPPLHVPPLTPSGGSAVAGKTI